LTTAIRLIAQIINLLHVLIGEASRAPSSTPGIVYGGEGGKVTKRERGVNREFSTGETTRTTRRFHIGENATGMRTGCQHTLGVHRLGQETINA
jgi:hypothetical protein